MQEHNVQIGPEFFKKSKNDYSSWRFAFVRELLQNAIDSGANEIKVNVLNEDNSLAISCKDNGSGMSKDILMNKLFSLGSSGKDFNNSVGGFGKAKELLYFSQNSYHIHSRDNLVNGIGGKFTIEPAEFYQGTFSKIYIDEQYYYQDTFEQHFREFIISSSYSGKFYLNDELISERVITDELVKQFHFGKVYKTDLFKQKIVVRINGLPMFENCTTTDYGLVLELSGKSSDHLSSNRDGFNWSCYTEFQNFLNILAQCSNECVRRLEPQIIKYFGKESYMTSMMKSMEDYIDQIEDNLIKEEAKILIWKAENNISKLDVNELEKLTEKISTKNIVAKLSQDIINIRNYVESQYQTDYDFEIENHFKTDVNENYLPESFNEYSKKLVENWRNVIKEILKELNIEQNFYVGFIFCNDIIATYRKDGLVCRYMINPFGKSDKEYYKEENYHEIILTACHEIVHSLGIVYHNETFLGKFEEILEKILPKFHQIKGTMNV